MAKLSAPTVRAGSTLGRERVTIVLVQDRSATAGAGDRREDARDRSQPSRHSYYVLSLLCFVYGLSFLDRQIFNILIDPIKAELHGSDTAMGLLSGLGFSLACGLLAIPIARWSDLGNRRRIVATAITVWSFMTALCGAAQSFWQLAVARIGVGVGEAGVTPASHSLISDYFPRDVRPRAMSIFETSIYIGVMCGYMVGGWLAQSYGWRAAFLVAGLPGLALAAVFYLTVSEPAHGMAEAQAMEHDRPSLADALRFFAGQSSLLLLVLGVVLAAFTNFAFGAWGASFLRRVHHMGSGEIGTWLGLANGVAGGAGTLLGGFVVSNLKTTHLRWSLLWPALTTAAAAPALILCVLTSSDGVCIFWYAVAMLLLGFQLGPCFAAVQSLSRIRMRALASALTNLLCNIVGGSLGPGLVGAMNDVLTARFGDQAVGYSLLLPACVPVIGALCFWRAAHFLVPDLARIEAVDEQT